ncbi:MAG: FecR domain-containing protein [Verrucomicrobia bacterium]|nr:FecR domain-containing protein [Verrucomicrobiota bacterium]
MKTPSNPIDEEASHWAARFDGGELSPSDKTAFSAWLNAKPEHQRVFAQYRELSAQLDTHIEARLTAAAETVVQQRKTSRIRNRIIAATLTAAAAIALTFTVLSNRSLDLATKTAERHVATLDDGSKVDLNARTELIVDFTRKERRVHLVSGEALFTVAKDAKRPFLVETSTGSVRVTGTVFNVRASTTSTTEVTVIEGTVRIRSSGDATNERPMTPGLQAVLSDKTLVIRTLPEGAAQDVIAWRQGQVVFNDTPLGEALNHFAAYHARTITIDPRVVDLRLGGRYSLDDLDGLLESIESILPVNVSHQSGDVLRITAAEPTKRHD